MKIRVDFFRSSGKWYEGGEVDIGEARLWKGDLKQAIVNNQEIIHDGWQGSYIVVTDDTHDNFIKEGYAEFFKWVYQIQDFINIKKIKGEHK